MTVGESRPDAGAPRGFGLRPEAERHQHDDDHEEGEAEPGAASRAQRQRELAAEQRPGGTHAISVVRRRVGRLFRSGKF